VQERRAEQLVAVVALELANEPGVCSKKSKVAVRAASVSTPSGERISTASGMLAILPRLR
jgi:hypothetical protein